MEGLFVGRDGVAHCFPSLQSALKEFDSKEAQGERAMEDGSAGFVTGAGTVNDGVLVPGNEGWIVEHLLWGEPFCAGDDLSVNQDVERLADIIEKHILL